MSKTAQVTESCVVCEESPGSNGRRPHVGQTHAIPKFIPHKLSFRPKDDVSLVDDKTLFLWRFRPEWTSLSKDAGYAILSKAELTRVRTYPNPALGKRFAVARACLREILSGLTGFPAADLPLYEDGKGRVHLDQARHALSIATIYAGAWVLIAVARGKVGLAASVVTPAGPSIGRSFDDDEIIDVQTQPVDHTRHHVRRAGLAVAADNVLFEKGDEVLRTDSPSVVFDARADGVWHLLDLPMPGTILATVAVGHPVSAAHGFGWVSHEGYPQSASKLSNSRRRVFVPPG